MSVLLTVRDEQVLDLGFIPEGQLFRPYVLLYPSNFDGCVRPGEMVRYVLKIVSDNFVSRRPQVFEVSWNENWSQNRDEMAKNLQIREVSDQRPTLSPSSR
jgi:hypothetical protein